MCLEIIVDCAAKYYFKDLFPIIKGSRKVSPESLRITQLLLVIFFKNLWGAGILQSIDVKISLYRRRKRGQMQSD